MCRREVKTVEAVSDEVLAGSCQTPKHVFGRAAPRIDQWPMVRSPPMNASRIYTLNTLKRVKTPVALKATRSLPSPCLPEYSVFRLIRAFLCLRVP